MIDTHTLLSPIHNPGCNFPALFGLQVRDDYEEPAYGMIDTLFSLAEAYLFMQLVELVVSSCSVLPSGAHRLFL